MIQLERTLQGEAPVRPLGALPEAREPIPLRRVRRVIEQDLDARMQDVFPVFDEEPFAISSLGQVHSAHTRDGEHVESISDLAGLAQPGVIGQMLILDALQNIAGTGRRILRPAQQHQLERFKVHTPL